MGAEVELRVRLLPGVLWAMLVLAGPTHAQTITLVNDAGLSRAAVNRLEFALTIQANRDLRRWWRTPRISFGAGGWKLILTNAPRPKAIAQAGLGGVHWPLGGMSWSGPPFAVDYVRVNGPDNWTLLASHELLEMLVDPMSDRHIGGQWVEICDPVGNVYYTIRGIQVSDFVTPAWFRPHSRGPWDFERFLGQLPG